MNDGLAEFLEEIAAACTKFATKLSIGEVAPLGLERSTGDLDGLGERQREIFEVLAAADDHGLTTSEIAKRMGGYETPNAHTALRTLESREVVEEVPNKRPIHWRLAPRYRGTSDPYLRIAALVPKGKWTTYGDISIAVRGDVQAARAVGRAAATLAEFPNPHRVLQSGGIIPSGWHPVDADAPDPEECRRRLVSDGVRFDERGRAIRENYIAWDALLELDGGSSSQGD